MFASTYGRSVSYARCTGLALCVQLEWRGNITASRIALFRATTGGAATITISSAIIIG